MNRAPERPRVFLTGGDGVGWALDDDLAQVRTALRDLVEESSLDGCDVIHSVWWEPLLRLPPESLAGRRVICHFSGEPFRCVRLPAFRHIVPLVSCWVAQSRQALEQAQALGLRAAFIPYTVNVREFRPRSKDDSEVEPLRRRWSIPRGPRLIGNFHRDSEGADLSSPKLVKGPDLLVEIAHSLHSRGEPVHVLLAGPRRHWVRRALAERGVPFTFLGTIQEDDDLHRNLLPRSDMGVLYSLLDLCLVTSRSEGGPRSVLEAASSRCKIISTRVGLAPDVLEPACLFAVVDEAIDLISEDIHHGVLTPTLDTHLSRVLANHRPEVTSAAFAELYRDTLALAPVSPLAHPPSVRGRPPSLLRRAFRRIAPQILTHRPLTVGLWHKFHRPPWGGGNQFMMALRAALIRRGVRVRENRLARDVDVHLLNSIHFDVEAFRARSRRRRPRVVHRIDGPIAFHRANGAELDAQCLALNREFASATVFQSVWTLRRMLEFGHDPVSPVVIQNSVDPAIFHAHGRLPSDPRQRIRLIASSWSDNERKGGPLYREIEERLDWSRYEFTFVGRASATFERAKQIAPVDSVALGALLRQHEIYVTAARKEACSNALLEALACGCPALYIDDGSHSEVVGFGGLPFSTAEEAVRQLDRLVANLDAFRRLIRIPSIEDVADQYLAVLRDVAGRL